MSLLAGTGLRTVLFALAAFAAVSVLSATPAVAGDRHHHGKFWLPPLPHVFVGLPPLVIEAGPPAPYYVHYGGYRRDGYGYRHDYEDDYREDRRHYRRHHKHHHRHHRHCGHDD